MVVKQRLTGSVPRYRLVWLLTILLFLSVNAGAIDSHQPISQMQHSAWSAKEGVIGEVLAIAQTSDGFIWIGTTGGLLRFDGSVFDRYKPEVGSMPNPAWVSALLATPNGGLWVGYLSGGASYLYRGNVTNYSLASGLPPGRVRGFACDSRGLIWIASAGGLGHFDGQRWQQLEKSALPPGIAFNSPSNVHTNEQGVWVSEPKQGVFLLPKGESVFHRVAPQLVQGYLPTFIDAGRDGTWLWAPETESLLRFPANSPSGPTSQPATVSSNGMFLHDRDGGAWMMTRGDGVWRIPNAGQMHSPLAMHDPSIEKFSEREGLTNATVYCAMEDKEGDIWVGTLGGLDRFRPRNAAWTQLQSVATQRMQLVAGENGEVWASSPQGLWDARTGKPVSDSPPNVHFSFRDPQGTIWLWSELGLSGDLWRWQNGHFEMVLSPSRENTNFAADKWVPAKGPIRALTRDGSGDLWVSIRGGGVFRLHAGSWNRIEILKDAVEMTAYGAICDDQGRVWIAYPERKAIGLWDHGNIRVFTSADGLNIGAITQITFSEGQVWAGGEFGLAFYRDGRFHAVEPAGGGAFGLVSGITGNPQSGLWLSTTTEIIRIPQPEVSHVLRDWNHTVQYERFDPLSDLAERPSDTSDTPAVMDNDGILWVATPRGVIRVDPAHLYRNPQPPQVAMRSVVANGISYSVYVATKLPPNTTDLRIGYSALSFSIPERVRSRYRLLGFDKEWQDGGNRVDITYKKLKPGHYTFQVMACNNDGVWNLDGASQELTIQPAFYQTIWFRFFYIASGGCIIWLFYRLRLRQVTAHVRVRYAERLAERTRIARELHDTLLQSLAGVSLQLDGIAKQAASRPEKLVSLITQVREMVDVCFLEARTKVWTLRSTSLEGPGLATTLREFCERVAPLTAARCDFSLIGEPRPLTPELEEELLRMAQEAVHNAVRHADASEIRVTLEYGKRLLTLKVSDNGRGFDVAEGLSKSDHWGLKNMRERAEQIHSRYQLTSIAGMGTMMEVSIKTPA